MPTKSKKPKNWLDTAVDIQKVLAVNKDTNEVFLGGMPLTDTQLKELKTELAVMDKMTLYHIILESVKQQAINVGINTSTSFENVLTAKALLVLLQWQREWATAIRKVQLKKTEV